MFWNSRYRLGAPEPDRDPPASASRVLGLNKGLHHPTQPHFQPLFLFCHVDQTQDFAHARQTLYGWFVPNAWPLLSLLCVQTRASRYPYGLFPHLHYGSVSMAHDQEDLA